MCGITGFISKSNKEIQFDDLLNANQHITHRGPDSEGYFYKSNNGIITSPSEVDLKL